MRCLDQKLWEELEGCFLPESTADYSGGAYALEGAEAIIEFMRRTMGATTMLTSHRVHHPEINIIRPDEATGTWAMEDVVILGDVGLNVQGAGFYEDRYVKRDSAWLIAHTGYRRSYEEIMPRASVAGLRITGDWWSTDGRSTLG